MTSKMIQVTRSARRYEGQTDSDRQDVPVGVGTYHRNDHAESVWAPIVVVPFLEFSEEEE